MIKILSCCKDTRSDPQRFFEVGFGQVVRSHMKLRSKVKQNWATGLNMVELIPFIAENWPCCGMSQQDFDLTEKGTGNREIFSCR